jgi:hypothetical protein
MLSLPEIQIPGLKRRARKRGGQLRKEKATKKKENKNKISAGTYHGQHPYNE